ncbi:IGHMBP2 family helicase [Halonatronum saccharophilum]|uniref:IGHMBP2 family helicase n=1 Tax=Halonatronum saccharophilum TaxID=150060 RepID=UPI000483C2D1|nr:IGHMBP2 family helicase [Halonatronum saccharophilum]
MIKLIVEGLSKRVGPGDIVGAFTNEAKIDGRMIGKIDLKGSFAIVEVEEEVADEVLNVMDGNQISGITVEIRKKDEEKKDRGEVEKYIDKYIALVQLEREEEIKRHELEIKRLSGYQREKKGRALLHLRGRDQGEAFGAKVIFKFIRQRRGEALPDHSIDIGDLVLLSKGDPLRKSNPTGTVVEKTKRSITVAFDKKTPNFLSGKGLRLDLYINDITFQRMLEALSILKRGKGRLKELRSKLLGFDKASFNSLPSVDFSNKDLNKSQKEAVRSSLAAKDFFLIHGPPGTGKTMTSIEVLEQLVKRGEKVLATADSNTAVDNLLERLIKRGIKVIRIGHPIRVSEMLRGKTLDYMVEKEPKYKEAIKLREKAYKLVEEQKSFVHPSGRWRRGLSNEQIKKLAKAGKSSRGISPKKIKEMGQWLFLQDEIDSLFKDIDRLEEEAVNSLIDRADVVCTTNSTAGSEVLAKKQFDTLLVDEATQATEPSVLIPLVKANKFILAGDHKQLPPTILNREAQEKGLSLSLFERLLKVHGVKIKAILNTQYRMNKDIMDFVSEEFYKGQLLVNKEIEDISLNDFDLSLSSGRSPAEEAIKIEESVIYFDTVGMRSLEESKDGSKSYSNRIEAQLTLEVAVHSLSSGIDQKSLGIITPYKDQVDRIKKLLKYDKVEVNTVDAFQGREKEIIILSLVRSNKEGNIGFLRDIRRLNVSLSRAKRKLVIIGDSSTVSTHPIYERLIDYVKDRGYYYQL